MFIAKSVIHPQHFSGENKNRSFSRVSSHSQFSLESLVHCTKQWTNQKNNVLPAIGRWWQYSKSLPWKLYFMQFTHSRMNTFELKARLKFYFSIFFPDFFFNLILFWIKTNSVCLIEMKQINSFYWGINVFYFFVELKINVENLCYFFLLVFTIFNCGMDINKWF